MFSIAKYTYGKINEFFLAHFVIDMKFFNNWAKHSYAKQSQAD